MKEFVCIGMACIPERVVNLRKSVPVLAAQCDRLHIHLNGAKAFPKEAWTALPSVTLSRSDKNLGDAEKLRALHCFEGWYLTVDDDILYPTDYVERLVSELESVNRWGVSCVHGSYFNARSTEERHFMDRRVMFGYQQARDKTTRVLIPGTGTACFHTSMFKPLRSLAEHMNMLDIYIASWAATEGLPIYCVPRKQDWLQDLPNHGYAAAAERPMDFMQEVVDQHWAGILAMHADLSKGKDTNRSTQ